VSSEAPLQIEAVLDLSEDGDACLIEIGTSDGRPLTPQVILDAVADMLMAKYSMDDLDWKVGNDDLDS
jgi:hypothetical protein